MSTRFDLQAPRQHIKHSICSLGSIHSHVNGSASLQVPLTCTHSYDQRKHAPGLDQRLAMEVLYLLEASYLFGIQLRTYGDETTPDASTNECCGLMIMSGVGTTYMMGGCLGYASGNQIATGMLYFTRCTGIEHVSHHVLQDWKDASAA